jgi:hypothetical protein
MEPDLINFKKICLEKVVSLFNRFLFTPSKHLFVRETFEFFWIKRFKFKKAFHRTKVKKLKFFKIDLKIKSWFSINFKVRRRFLSFSISFCILFFLIVFSRRQKFKSAILLSQLYIFIHNSTFYGIVSGFSETT